ncbi:MAG TPA: MFS transporter [Solirubrobacteraceae bacterium]|jgi:EmrB/QacA subfamily drug resistance transporter|nr:MFS transporter [Solirubrobacteraceae bacterium]
MTSTAKRSHPNVTLAVLALGGMAYAMLSSLVVPALPTMQHDLHTTETGIAWLLTGYLLAASVGTSILGRLGDMYGKERLLLWTLGILAAGTILAAVSSSLIPIIIGRVIQGAGGGIFPLAFGIVRDEFPREKVAGAIGLLSAILGVGGGIGIVLAGVIIQHLSYHWLFWIPLVLVLIAAAATWRYVPESPVRVPGKINWLAAGLMTIGISAVLLAISETTTWGWGGPKTILLLLAGGVFVVIWIAVETRSQDPLVDMTMMRIRGVWTTNLAAFLLGAGMYASFIVFPQFAQLPKRTGFGFGASVVVSGLYLLPATITMTILGVKAGAISARFGSRVALIAGTAFATASFAMLAAAHAHPWEFLVAAALLGIGIGLAFAALGNLIVQAVPSHQTGVASGVNTVMRTLGGALGGQISATFIAGHVAHGLPTVTGFTETFAMATGFLAVCLLAAWIVPRAPAPGPTPETADGLPGLDPASLVAVD